MSRADGGPSRTSRRPRRTILRALAASVLVILSLAVLLGVVLYSRLTATPEWWTPELTNDAQAVALGEEAEKGMTRVLSRERASGESWSIEVTQEQANAWLATRLERWARNQHANWPAAARGVRVRFDDQAITLGVAIDSGGSGRFASITLVPESAEGRTRFRAESARVGVQSVPLGAVRSTIEKFVPDRAIPEAIMDAIRAGVIELPDSLALDEHRRVRVVGVESRGGPGTEERGGRGEQGGRGGRLRIVCEMIEP